MRPAGGGRRRGLLQTMRCTPGLGLARRSEFTGAVRFRSERDAGAGPFLRRAHRTRPRMVLRRGAGLRYFAFAGLAYPSGMRGVGCARGRARCGAARDTRFAGAGGRATGSVARPFAMIAPNTIVGGRYRVVKPLGGGGMKLVYLAEDLRLAARRCALAEVVDNFTNPDAQRQAIDAFQREADMLARLNNEHIPRVFDRFSEQNHHYLVMEYVDGVTLEEEMKEAGGKLEDRRVIDFALQVLDTLTYLH